MNLNRVMLGGNLTRDVEVKSLQGGTSVANFGMAINRKWKDAGGNEKEEVTFLDCEAWGKTGEAIAKFLGKGKPIFVEGRLKLEQWEKDGQKHSKIRVVVESFQFVGRREDGQGGSTAPAQTKPSWSKPSPATASAAPPDDIPF